MRALLGIAIALPIAAAFCLAYLTMLALEALRDVKHEDWTSPARVAT